MAVNSQRNFILQKLHDRNKKQRDGYATIILLNNKLFEDAESAKAKIIEQSLEVEKMKQENVQLQIRADSGGGGGGGNSKAVDQRLLKLQEELTEMHRNKGQNAQKIIDLNNAIQEKEKELHAKDERIRGLMQELEQMSAKISQQEHDNHELRTTNQILTDEQQALHLAFASLEEKFRKLQEDNNDLVSRWLQYKSQAADQMNAENDQVLKKRDKVLQKQLAEAAKEQKVVKEPVGASAGPAVCFAVTIPAHALQTFDAHDGEVNAVRWSPSGRRFATGGSDRKVKIWEVQAGRCCNMGTLMGSNGAVTSVEFDLQETFVLGASYDFAVRLWSFGDQRLRHTLTGHSNKVMASKFLSGSLKCVSGSFDRTIKIWDLRRGACDKTIFAGSSCFDLVTCDSLATNIISGHFDRKLRFWDTRTERGSNDIQLQGKVTSVDLSPDGLYLLSSTRDDALHIIDLRMNQIYKTLTADGFKVGSDWSRAVFSPDGHYAMAGSNDGAIYIWNVYKQKVEKVLREHSHTVLSCSWDPKGSSLLSSDKSHTVVYWADF